MNDDEVLLKHMGAIKNMSDTLDMVTAHDSTSTHDSLCVDSVALYREPSKG